MTPPGDCVEQRAESKNGYNLSGQPVSRADPWLHEGPGHRGNTHKKEEGEQGDVLGRAGEEMIQVVCRPVGIQLGGGRD